ncbi:MAG TPA: non-ribosomal peptide synthetase [Candidatus Binataceae bacterium]|nr:non-ribosomal peptide synthetase [Candidatus Binataceae bacterium]
MIEPERGSVGARVRPANAFTPFAPAEIEQSISARFESQAARRPSALALCDETRRWSYGELNGFANRVARAILEATPPGNRPVVLLFEQEALAIGAILGVLKAGRVYVPLSPRLPTARLATILADSQADLILTNERSAPVAREFAGGTVKTLMVDRLADNSVAERNLGLAIPPDALAYILYTSGSTGVPKGVVQNHRNVLHYIMNYTNGAHLDAADRLSLIHYYEVSAAPSPIFGAILNGASLHLFDLRAQGFTRLADWIGEQAITVYHSTPQVFRGLAQALPAGAAFPALRLIRLGGETLMRADLELYRQHFPEPTLLLNTLAATELNLIRMFFADHATSFEGPIAPVGYEVPDTEVVLLDDDGREVAGVGEIAIRSPYLFCGYWRKPELTATVVSQCPDGRRLLHIGDRGLMLPDGCLVHLGRRDSRLKIRGFTVEVAEVEAALMTDSSVRQAMVIGRPDNSGETRLIAYVASEASAAELRRRLTQSLPGPMIPTTFVRLDTLPVTPGGKIDRHALPDPEPLRTGVDPPRDPDELQIARIWEELLGTWPVGIRDEFFELGGDSLLALQLITRLEALSTKPLPMSMLLEAATVERQAAILRDANWSPSWPTVVTLQPHGDQPGLFCLPGAGAGVLALVALARRLGEEQPFYGLQPPGLDGAGAPMRKVEELAGYFADAIRGVQPHGPYFLGGVSFGGLVALEIAQQLTRSGEQVASVAMLDTFGPGYPRMRWNAPLRFRLFRRFGEPFPQRADRSWSSVLAELRELWMMRVRLRLRRLRGRPVPQRNIYFNWRTAALTASRSYRPRPYPGPVTLFRLTGRPSAALYHPDPLLGWDRLSMRSPAVVELNLTLPFPGAHSAMLREPAVGELADRLREHLRAARASCLDDSRFLAAGK